MRQIYTDGACSGMRGGWAYSIDGKLTAGAWPSGTTNNQMEMLAVVQAVRALEYGDEAVIYTDSKLVIGWLSRGWKANMTEIMHLRVAYRTFVQLLDLRIRFVHVHGHKACAGNVAVDKAASNLARNGEHLSAPHLVVAGDDAPIVADGDLPL